MDLLKFKNDRTFECPALVFITVFTVSYNQGYASPYDAHHADGCKNCATAQPSAFFLYFFFCCQT